MNTEAIGKLWLEEQEAIEQKARQKFIIVLLIVGVLAPILGATL